MIILNILNNFFKRNNYQVILKKLFKRLEKKQDNLSTKWARDQADETIYEWMKKINFKLYQTTKYKTKLLKQDAEKILKNNNFYKNLKKSNIGGGAAYELLYFLTAKLKPKVIVETGTAAGWSTLAFLRASKNRKDFKIFSSDFPFFKYKNPEKYIGILTKNEDNLKKLNLFIDGDEKNLRQIIKKLGNKKIDLLHYDSDKSYSGREFCLKILKKHFSHAAILIFDDIHNNFHFRDFVKNYNLKYNVLKYKTGFIGLVDLNNQG